MEPTQEKTSRKRRTKEELLKYHQDQIKRFEEEDKKEVIRLLSGIHDDLVKVSTFAPAKGAAAEVTAAVNSVKAALAKVGK